MTNSANQEHIIAYVDGELNQAARADLEARAAADPELAAQIAAHQALTAKLQAAFGSVAEEPVPDTLKALLTEPASPATAEVIAFRPAPEAKAARVRPLYYQIAAMAACFVAGVGLSVIVSTNGGDFKSQDGALMAHGDLGNALSRQLASDTTNSKAPTIGLTFADETGTICRTFTTAANEGLACQDDGDWRIDALTGKTADGEFRQAGSPLILQAVEARLSGDVFDTEAEKKARDSGWILNQ